MREKQLWDPVQHLRGHGITIRKGFPGLGEPEFMLEFERSHPWPPARIKRALQVLETYRTLIRLQLDVPPGMPFRSIESLRAKGYIKIVELEPRKHRLVLTKKRRNKLEAQLLRRKTTPIRIFAFS